MVIYSYFIKLHQSTPGSLIQEPSFFQKQSIQEQSQPLGRQQSHIQAAGNREKWIPSGPEKSLSIHEQNYPIQVWSFRIAEFRFLHTMQQKQHATALMQLLHQILKFQYIPEQSYPLGRQQSHIQAASNQEKWIPSGPEKSLSIHKQTYPIQAWSFRIAEIRFLHTVQQRKQHAAALMQLLHQILKFQYIPEQSHPLGRHQSHIQAASNREKWIPSGSEKSLSIHEQNYPIQEWSFRIGEIRFLHTVQQKQHAAALMQLLHQSPKIQFISEPSQPLGRQQSQIQAVSHRVKWKGYSEKWCTFFPHYSHPPYHGEFTTDKQESQSNRACSPIEAFGVAR